MCDSVDFEGLGVMLLVTVELAAKVPNVSDDVAVNDREEDFGILEELAD